MKQLKVALPDTLRAWLEERAKESGKSLSEEIRSRLELDRQSTILSDRPTADLTVTIVELAALVRDHFGWDWFEHPDALAAFWNAIATRLTRVAPKEKPEGEPPHKPQPVVLFDDAAQVGIALEGVQLCDRLGLSPEQKAEATKRMVTKLSTQKWSERS